VLQVITLAVSPFQSNCHLIFNPETREALVIDPGDDAPIIIEALEKEYLKLVAIWNTHGHIDHINANQQLHEISKAEICIHQFDAPMLESEINSGASLFGLPFSPSKASKTWVGGENIELLGTTWQIMHTPGHSAGCCCYVCPQEEIMFAGDLLFQGSIGRTDLPGGDPEAMTETLRNLFNDWGQDKWKVYCGHGPSTTLADERDSNMYVRQAMMVGL
jgi:hydroxyacylglutathione hydrolase